MLPGLLICESDVTYASLPFCVQSLAGKIKNRFKRFKAFKLRIGEPSLLCALVGRYTKEKYSRRKFFCWMCQIFLELLWGH